MVLRLDEGRFYPSRPLGQAPFPLRAIAARIDCVGGCAASPRFILEKIAEHRLDPARCWMTGDRVTDWEAGLNAGIRSCAMRSGAAKPEELAQAAARGVAGHDDFPAFVRAELKLSF